MSTPRALALLSLLSASSCITEELTPPDSDMEEAAVMSGPAGTYQTVLIDRRRGWMVHDWGAIASWPQDSCCFRPLIPAPLGYGERYIATPVDFGGDPAHKHITTYFEQTFDVPRPVRKLYLRVMYDDGFVFYLNGEEGGRAHMPSGTITSSTRALGHEAGNQYTMFDISAQIPNLRIGGGNNRLQFEVHQASPSSSDLVFDAELIAWVDGPLDVTSVDSVPSRSYWHFWDRPASPGTWKTRGYVDSGWSAGRGPLGHGEPYLTAETSPGTITTYFRKQLTIDPEAIGLVGHVMYDDGFVVYLNGSEIGRASMPSGTITPSTLASGHEANDTYRRFDWSYAMPLLVAGSNVLAVEVHQSAAASSDLVFDLALEVIGGWSNLSETRESFHDVSFADTQRGIAVGWLGRLWRTSNGGVQWIEQPTGTTEDLRRIVFVDPQHGWITGDNGTLLRTGNGGATWTPSSGWRTVTPVSPVSATTAWMVATLFEWDNGAFDLFKTTDGGATWELHTLYGRSLFAPFDRSTIHMADASRGWLVTRDQEFGDLRIERTEDGGDSWTVQWTGGGPGERLDGDFEVIDAQTAWMVGGTSATDDHGEFKLVTRDGGATWTEVPPSVYDVALLDAEFVGPSHGWAIGAGGAIIATEDGGATWQGQQPPGTGPTYSAIRFVDVDHGWAVAFDTVLHTSTGGW